MATSAMGAAMKGPMYSFMENGAERGGHVFHFALLYF